MCECRIERGKGQENLRKQKSRTIFESLKSAERKKVAKSAASRKERGEKANATTRKGTKARGVRQSQKRGARREVKDKAQGERQIATAKERERW